MIIMPTFRCDFVVRGDLVLPIDVPELVLKSSDELTVTFKNGRTNEQGHPVELLATVIGSAPSLDDAQNELRGSLAEQLSLLAFVTHSRFKIVKPVRLVEWTPGQKERRMQIFHTRDVRDPPAPELEAQFLETVAALEKAQPPPFARTALKFFRYGLLDDQPEDQFMRLWLALEVVAENVKERDRVAITCSECGAPIKCTACAHEPSRIPMAKQAIDQLIFRFAGKSAAKVSKRQFMARNGLMHGRSREAIEAECEVPLDAIVDELGVLTWKAIMSTIRGAGDGKPLAFGHRDGVFTNKSLILAALLGFEHTGKGPHPADGALPSAEVTLETRFRKNQ
jgi:hypothetical protein